MHLFYVLFSHREILKNLTLRNLRVRYKGSALGVCWVLLNPLLTMAVLYLVFSHIMRIDIPQYPLFLLAGLLPWGFFASALTEATSSVIDNANLVKKIYFPREILPIAHLVSGFVNLLFSLAIFLCVLLIFRVQTLKFIYLLPLVLMIHFVFTAGLALLLSCANVYWRDTGHILGIFLMFWFYLTPIFYPPQMVPARFYHLYFLNPMASIITMYRNILFEGKGFSLSSAIVTSLVAIITLQLGHWLFKKLESSFAKEI